jgi:signal transduction histidine kinase
MQRKNGIASSELYLGVTGQLALSHGCAVLAALAAYVLMNNAGMQGPLMVPGALLVGVVVGLLLTANIQYGLYVLGLALTRFAQGEAVEQLKMAWRWPLSHFFTAINAINKQMQAYAQQAYLTNEYREQLLRQASEAAALAERNRIARDLHDSIKQQIFSISISAAAAKAHASHATGEAQEDVAEAVEDIQRSAREAQVEMQALLQQLRGAPLENTNLAEALQTQAQALGYRTGARMVVEIGELPPPDRLLPTMQETIFRMVQEAFANIARHARASTVWLTLQQRGNALYMEIRDDGQGFDSAQIRKGMGLNNLHERAATLGGSVTIQSGVGKGTTISAVIPLVELWETEHNARQREWALKRNTEQAVWGFQLSELAGPIAFGMIIAALIVNKFMTIPPLAIAISVLAIIYGYLHGWYFTTRVMLVTDKQNLDILALQRRMHNARLWLLRVAMAGVWYLFVVYAAWRFSSAAWLGAGATAVLAVLFVLEQRLHRHTVSRYYDILSTEELQWEVGQWARATAKSFRIWLIGTGLFIVYDAKALTFPPNMISAWVAYLLLATILAWGVLRLVDYRQLQRWRARVQQRTEMAPTSRL